MGERRTGSDNMIFELTITNPYRAEWFGKSNTEQFASLPFVTIAEDKNKDRIGYAEINTIEELMQLLDVADEEVIIGKPNVGRGLPYIEIYNDYRE